MLKHQLLFLNQFMKKIKIKKFLDPYSSNSSKKFYVYEMSIDPNEDVDVILMPFKN